MLFVLIAESFSDEFLNQIKRRIPGDDVVRFNDHIQFVKIDNINSAAKALEKLGLTEAGDTEFVLIQPRDWGGHGQKEFRDRIAKWGAEAAKEGDGKDGKPDAEEQGRTGG